MKSAALPLLLLTGLLAGCFTPHAEKQPSPKTNLGTSTLNPGPEQEKELTAIYNLTLFGSWNAATINGHILDSLGYHNCVSFDLQGVNLTRVQAIATWDDQLQPRATVFHIFKTNLGPFFGLSNATGASPLAEGGSVPVGGKDRIELGILPPQDVAG